jgi:hypothetical protein
VLANLSLSLHAQTPGVQVRIYGEKILTIEYGDYAVRAKPLEAKWGQ